MKAYQELVEEVLRGGSHVADRTGVGTISKFSPTPLRVDLRDGFPLLTTKKVNWSSVVKELLWFLRGQTNIDYLGCKIWDAWAGPHGDVGPVYGHAWRNFGGQFVAKDGSLHRVGQVGVDQIGNLVRDLRHNPASRRHMVVAFDPSVIEYVGLPPCHAFFQCSVSNGHLDLQMYQRSADLALGVPFNIASYALLTHLLALEVGLTPRYVTFVYGDAHVYLNHVDGLTMQLARQPRPLPELRIEPKMQGASLETAARSVAFISTDFKLEGYDPHPPISFEVAV